MPSLKGLLSQWRFDGATARITASINRNRDYFAANFSNYHQSKKWAESLETGGAWLSIRKSREWPAGSVGGGPNRVPARQTRPPYHDWYKSVSCEIPMSDPSPKTIRINHLTQPQTGQLSYFVWYLIPHPICTRTGRYHDGSFCGLIFYPSFLLEFSL